MNPTAEIFSALEAYDTPTVLNVIELLEVRPRHEGYLDHRLRALYPDMPPIAGRAVTATFRSSPLAPGEETNYDALYDQVEDFLATVPAPRIVVFQDLDDPPVAATYGEVMTTIYQSFGCRGLITSGAARDHEQVKALGFPCWSSSLIASHGYCRIVDFGKPVEVAGQRIEAGQPLHADANGVALLPEAVLDRLAEGCRRFVEAEDIVLEAARAPGTTIASLREAKARLAAAVAELSRDLKS